MGLREKVTIALVIIALTQIACRHCMPRTPRKASLKRYLNDLKPVINNPIPTPYSPSRVNKTPKQTFRKTAQNSRISQNSLPNKSLYKTYNFPENEFPLDNSPRDAFHIGMNFNENNHMNTLQKTRNLQSSAITDLKKEMKMKRKLLSNKQVNYGNSQLKTDMSSIKSVSNPDSTRLSNSEAFPEVQYPLNAMDMWGPNYWNSLPFTQERTFHGFGQQAFNLKVKEDINKPLTRLAKAKAGKYLQSYDKLKEEHRRTSTENSKRSNIGQKGLNFTKAATCERVSDDFIIAGLVSNISSYSTEMKKALTSSENICPVTEYPYHPRPIPYKVIEDNTENICPADEPKNKTKELQDVDNSVIAQTLQLIQEILFNDDTSLTVLTGNFSKEIEKNMNTSDYTVVPANEDISTTLMESVTSCTVSPTEELSQEVADDGSTGNLRNNMTSLPAELISENTTTVAGPLNVRMSIPYSESITYEALTNALSPGLTPLSNGNAVPSTTSIFIIPFNNNDVGKSQSHMFGTSPDTPIIVYLPSSQSSDYPPQLSSFNRIVSSLIHKPVPNNQVYNFFSNMAPLQNDNPLTSALISEVINSNSDKVSSLPIHETLSGNSISYKNESNTSSMREKPITNILIDKSLIDDAPFVITTCDQKLPVQITETGDLLDVNTDSLPPISDFEHPIFDFYGSDFTSLSHGPYNNILHNELPIITREIDSDQQILNVSSKDLFIPTQNVTSEHLHKTTSMDSVSDSLSEIQNDVPRVELDKNFLSETPTGSTETLKTKTLLYEYIPNLPLDTITERLPQPIDKILLSTPLIKLPTAELPQPKESSRSHTLLSETLTDKLPIIMDIKVPLTPVSDTTTDSAPQHIGNLPSPPILNSSPMMTDMTLKTELYKMRQILDKMLFTETPTYSQPPPIDITLLSISESDPLLPMNETPTETLPLPTTDNPIDCLRPLAETLPPISVNETPLDSLPLSGLKFVNKILETDTRSLPIDKTVLPTLVSESSADNKPYYVLDDLVTSRTKDTPDNGLSHKIDDLSFKMDLKFQNIYEVSSDDLPHSVDDLPTKVHPEHTTNGLPGVSTNDLPTQVVETLTPVSKISVSDLPKPTDLLSLPVDEILEGVSLEVPTDSVKTLMSGSIDKLLQDFSSPKVLSDGLPTLPMNTFKLSIHETFPDGQFKEISSEGPPQKHHLPQTVQKLILDLSLADVLTNEPSFKYYSPSLVIDKYLEFPYSTAVTKDLPLVVEHLLSPENDVTADSLVTDNPGVVSLSTNLERQQSTNLDKANNEMLSESTLSDLPRDNLPLPEVKMLSLTDNKLNDLSLPIINKTPSTSKLPITKALLENVLSDITKGGSSLVVVKALPVTPHSLLDKTLHHVDEKTPLSKTKDIPLRPVEKIIPNLEHTEYNTNQIDYIPFPKEPEDTSISDLPSELPLPKEEMDEDNPYILTDDVEDHDKNETQSLDSPTYNLPITIDKGITKTPSSSKLPITKTLLENVLSDITKGGLSSVVAKALPVTPYSLLDKTLHHVDEKTPLSKTKDIPLRPVEKIIPNSEHTEYNSNQIDYIPFPKELEDTSISDLPPELPLPKDEMDKDNPYIPTDDVEYHDKNETQSLDSPTYDLPITIDKGITKTPPSSKLPITKTLLENVLSDITKGGLSSVVAKALPVTPHSLLDKTLHHVDEKTPISKTKDIPLRPIEKIIPNTEHTEYNTNQIDYTPLPKEPEDTSISDLPSELPLPKDEMDKDNPYIPTDDVEDHDKNETQSLDSPTYDLPIPIDKGITKTPSPSKLPITKALLENVLTDITKGGLTSVVAKALPVTPHSLLDKTLHHIDEKTPISKTKDILLRPIEKIIPNSEHTEYNTNQIYYIPFPKEPEDTSIPDFPSELPLSKDEMDNDNPYIPTDDVEDHDKNETQSLDSPTYDLPITIDKGITKTPSSLKLPITKALLENVLSDITTRGFSVSVAQSLPVTTSSVLDKTLYVESPISHITKDNASLPVDKIVPNTSLPDQPPDNLPIFAEDTLPLPIDKSISELQSLDIPPELSSSIDNIEPDIPIISMYNKDQNEIENPSSKNVTDDLSSASTKEDILSLPKDTPTDLPNIKTPSPSKLITKALLENVLSDINTRGISLPAAKALPVAPRSQLDKTLYFLDSPVSDMTEKSSVIPIDNFPYSGKYKDVSPRPTSKTLPDNPILDIPTDKSLMDRIHNSDIVTNDIEQEKKTEILTDDVKDRDKSDNIIDNVNDRDTSDHLTYVLEDDNEDKSDIWSDDVEANDKSDNLTDAVEDRAKSDNLTGDIEVEESNESYFSDVPTDDMPSHHPLPRTNPYLASRIPITKALLEKVLSDITDGGIHP